MSAGYPFRDDNLRELVRKDPRYGYGAYEFVFEGLGYTQHRLGRDAEELPMRDRHVTGRQLLDGIRELALEQFGLMALAVFRQWGIHTTADFGQIVFNLVENDLLKKTEGDRREDFQDVYDFEEAFRADYRIPTEPDVP